jgi:hypothetical protein
MFARPVKVKLLQFVFDVAERQRAALGEIQLDSVAVVDDGVGAAGPADSKRRQSRLDGRADIDRRLLRSDRADLVGGVEIAPFGRTDVALVAPMRAFGYSGSST